MFCFPWIASHKHGCCVRTHGRTEARQRWSYPLWRLSFASRSLVSSGRMSYVSVCMTVKSREPERCVDFLSFSTPSHTSVAHTRQTGSLSFSLPLKDLSSCLNRYCYQTSNRTPLWQPFYSQVQSAKITIPHLYLYWGKPSLPVSGLAESTFHAGHALFSPGSGTPLVCQVAGPDCLL